MASLLFYEDWRLMDDQWLGGWLHDRLVVCGVGEALSVYWLAAI